MIEKAILIFHKCFRACGFDIRSVKNLNIALKEIEQQRQQRYLRWLAEMRSRRIDEFSPTETELFGEHEVEIAWVEADDLFPTVCARVHDANVVLDIGCGIRPQPFVEAAVHICCEPFDEYMHRLMVETAAEKKYVYLQCDLQNAVNIFPSFSVDSVFLIDVIEHIEREVALECLRKITRIPKYQVIVFTPLGFMPQENLSGHCDRWGMGGGAWQEHKSAWQPEDFPAKEGWEVIACRDFHRRDAHGEKLDPPIGAMYAIKNFR